MLNSLLQQEPDRRKSNLIKTLKKDGLLILSADDEDVLQMKNKTKNLTLTFGFKKV